MRPSSALCPLPGGDLVDVRTIVLLRAFDELECPEGCCHIPPVVYLRTGHGDALVIQRASFDDALKLRDLIAARITEAQPAAWTAGLWTKVCATVAKVWAP